MLDVTEIQKLSLENKTIEEWHKEIRSRSHRFRVKYDNSFERKRVNPGIVRFWRKTSELYFRLSELLEHLNRFKGIYKPHSCLSCAHNPTHVERLKTYFLEFYPFVIRCKDGFQFKK